MATLGIAADIALCISVLVLAIFCGLSSSYAEFPTRDVVSRWADLLHSRLIPQLDKFSGIKNLEKTYDDMRKGKLVKLDGVELVRKMSMDLTKNLEKKMSALERLVEAAEAIVKNYEYNPLLKVMKDLPKMNDYNESIVTYSEKFKRGVNYSESGVHIPVGIYEGYPEILNGLQWSKELDRVFEENHQRDPDLMWQYFGSRAGFMRTYPGHMWTVLARKPDFPDLYDVRLRPWYVHATSSPKDMLILMDTSGSMHGQTMEIMKIAVKTLLTTLGENDFVNIAYFNDSARWIACFDTFVQANRRNKQILSQAIDNLKDKNMANLSKGLEFAFKNFEHFAANKSDPWEGSECHKIIMLFSDGGTEEAWEVLDKYNMEKKIRIFAYVVGPHPVPYAALKKIACSYRGYFTNIPAMGAIRANIQDYLKILSRPLVLSGEKNFQWTNLYLDAMGLGLMTTVTLPVFNTSLHVNQSMVGVMGIDVPLQEMWDSEPSYEVGPASYSFGLNENGFVVFHPNLKMESEFFEDPQLLDFLEVEIGNVAKEEIRMAMVNRETGNKSITSLIKMPDKDHIVRHQMEYFYTPLNKTSFSIALVIPTDRTHNLVVDGMDIEEGLGIDDDNVDGVFLAPWKYCHNFVLTGSTEEIVKNLSTTLRIAPHRCKRLVMQRLLWDIRKTEDIVHYWETEDSDNKREGVIATFVQTEGGLTKIFPPSKSHHLSSETDPSRSLIFQRAFYSEDYVFFPPKVGFEVTGNESHEGVSTIIKSISFARSGVTYKPAVVGVIVDPLMWLQPFLLTTPAGQGKVPISCSDVDDINCYLIDDGGFIISTNQLDHQSVVGKFLGQSDVEIMTELYEKEIYTRNEEFNYEDRCEKEPKVNAGFRSPVLPFFTTLLDFNFGWLFDYAAWSQLKYWLFSWLAWGSLPTSEALPEFYELPNETVCNTHRAQYYLGRWGRKFSGIVHCGNCSRNYSLAKVGKTNLLLLVTTRPCTPFCDPLPPLLQEAMPDIGRNVCDLPLQYRVRPDKCYSYNPDEDTSDCGSGNSLPLPYLALFLEFFCFFLIVALEKNFFNHASTC